MKRKWFQVHLSTAVVLMFVLNVIVILNTITRHSDPPDEDHPDVTTAHGFPYIMLAVSSPRNVSKLYGWRGDILIIWTSNHSFDVDLLRVGKNAFIALVVLIVVWLSVESLIRRRERGRLPVETKDVG